MASRFLIRSLLTTTKQSIFPSFPRSLACVSVSAPHFSFLRLCPFVAASAAANFRQVLPSDTSVPGFSMRRTASSLNNPNPNRASDETMLCDGCDFEHWIVIMDAPEGNPTRDEIIDIFIKTLAKVVGSEEEARMKIYSVSTRHYYSFSALLSKELSHKLSEVEKVSWVLPDAYADVENKVYYGVIEPFINGQAVPYDPKYHADFVESKCRLKEKSGLQIPDHGFERREMRKNRGLNMRPSSNMGGVLNAPSPPQNGKENQEHWHFSQIWNSLWGKSAKAN